MYFSLKKTLCICVYKILVVFNYLYIIEKYFYLRRNFIKSNFNFLNYVCLYLYTIDIYVVYMIENRIF